MLLKSIFSQHDHHYVDIINLKKKTNQTKIYIVKICIVFGTL